MKLVDLWLWNFVSLLLILRKIGIEVGIVIAYHKISSVKSNFWNIMPNELKLAVQIEFEFFCVTMLVRQLKFNFHAGFPNYSHLERVFIK